MKKSIGDNLIPKNWKLENGLALIRKAGFEGVELWLGDKPWFQLDTTDAQVRELRQKVEDAGLLVSNVSNTLDWETPISSRDPAIREKASRHIIRQIEAANILGTDAILVVAGLVTEDTPYNEVYRRTVDAMRQLSETASRARVRIGCENCCSEQRFLISPREFKTFLDDVNSPSVGLHLDVGNIHDTGFPEQWIEIHGPRITRIHVKDVLRHRGRCGNQSVYTNLFLGDNNWPAIRSALEKIRYDGWIIAEMESVYRYAPDQQFFDTSAAMSRFIEGRL
jgi:hexulose-6-phosphate isomerase